MIKVRNFIWDFDGTLFDTYPATNLCLKKALNDYGFDMEIPEIMRGMLQTVNVCINQAAERFGLDAQALHDKWAYYRTLEAPLSAKPFEGVSETLSQIVSRGGRNFMFSHNTTDLVNAYFEKYGIAKYFTEIVTADNGFGWKPSPDAILYLIDKYGFAPSDSVMVGDREIDLASGRNAATRTCHFVCDIAPEHLSADAEVTKLTQILDCFEVG